MTKWFWVKTDEGSDWVPATQSTLNKDRFYPADTSGWFELEEIYAVGPSLTPPPEEYRRAPTHHLAMVDGHLVKVSDFSDQSDEEIIALAVAVQREIRGRIGRCQLCGEIHSSFNRCPRPGAIPVTIRTRSEFEERLNRALKGAD